jgi:hypothetical protein
MLDPLEHATACGDPVQEFVRDVTSAKPRLSGQMLPILHPDAAGIDIGAEEIKFSDQTIRPSLQMLAVRSEFVY